MKNFDLNNNNLDIKSYFDFIDDFVGNNFFFSIIIIICYCIKF